MSDTLPFAAAESRALPRLKLPAAYTLVRVRIEGQTRFSHTGYIYDISRSGMRFELDRALEPGTRIEVKAMLPGVNHTRFTAQGCVMRLHDDESAGPVRMGMSFESFSEEVDVLRLESYLRASGLRETALPTESQPHRRAA